MVNLHLDFFIEGVNEQGFTTLKYEENVPLEFLLSMTKETQYLWLQECYNKILKSTNLIVILHKNAKVNHIENLDNLDYLDFSDYLDSDNYIPPLLFIRNWIKNYELNS